MRFRVPLPERCRGCGERKSGTRRRDDSLDSFERSRERHDEIDDCAFRALFRRGLRLRLRPRFPSRSEGLRHGRRAGGVGVSHDRIIAFQIECRSIPLRRKLMRRLQVSLERFKLFATT